jgi:predicted ATP-dependent protease
MTCFTKKCNKCQIDLVIGDNWTEANKKNYNNICNNCKKIKQNMYYKNNKENERQRKKLDRIKNPKKYKDRYAKYYKENSEKEKLRCREYKKNNKNKISDYRLHYERRNTKTINSKTAKRRAKKLQALPTWANLEAIKEFYKKCPKGYHVDHIYPLQSNKVCGLHVLANLQYLIASDNIRKSNKMPEELHDN